MCLSLTHKLRINKKSTVVVSIFYEIKKADKFFTRKFYSIHHDIKSYVFYNVHQ